MLAAFLDPVYEYGWTVANVGDGTYRVYAKIRQTQTNAGTFTMPLRLTLVTGAGNDVRTVWNDAAEQDFVLTTTSPVSNVSFDQDDWILKNGEALIPLGDADVDGVPEGVDNCAGLANAAQRDFAAAGAGDACDADNDADLLADGSDCAAFDATQGTPDEVLALGLEPNAGMTRRVWHQLRDPGGYHAAGGPLSRGPERH